MPLIINADDLGYSENRDIGIFEAFECNAITAASLMVNGPTCKKAAEKAKEVGLYLSLHLNLTEGGSLTGPSSITNEKNEMYYKCDFWNLIHHSIEQYADAIKKETIAQIEKFKELTGGYPAHIDGHQHVHIFPNMPDILAPIFSKYGVKSTRVPDEDISNYEWLDAERKERYESRFPTCLRGRLVYRSYNILAPECFIGLALMGEYMSRERFFNSLTGAFGTIEWMVHPGKSVQPPKRPRSFFRDLFDQSSEREHELITLKNIEHTCPLTDWSHYDFNKCKKFN